MIVGSELVRIKHSEEGLAHGSVLLNVSSFLLLNKGYSEGVRSGENHLSKRRVLGE